MSAGKGIHEEHVNGAVHATQISESDPLKQIPHFHDFIAGLPTPVREELERLSSVRAVDKDQAIYRQGDPAAEMYQLIEGAVKMCNYTADGKEVVTGSFRAGDCFGEMGLIDGLPRISHAIAIEPATLRVLPAAHFNELYRKYPEISQQLNLMLCRRVRLLYALSEEASSLNLHQRLARALHRLSCSHGFRDQHDALYIGTSHEELGKMLGASRQSISKELKALEGEGVIALRYGKIYILDVPSLNDKYEDLMGMEQIAAVYDDGM